MLEDVSVELTLNRFVLHETKLNSHSGRHKLSYKQLCQLPSCYFHRVELSRLFWGIWDPRLAVLIYVSRNILDNRNKDIVRYPRALDQSFFGWTPVCQLGLATTCACFHHHHWALCQVWLSTPLHVVRHNNADGWLSSWELGWITPWTLFIWL